MRVTAFPLRHSGDTILATVAAAVLGCGAVLAAIGAMSGSAVMAVSGSLAAGAALMVLLVAGWVDAVPLLVLSLAAPAPYSSDSLRLAPAAMATAAVVLAWILQRGVDRRAVEMEAVPTRAAAGLLAALVLSAVCAQQLGPAVRELINWTLLLGLLVVVVTELKQAPRRTAKLALLIAAVMGVAGALAVLQGIRVLPGRFLWGASFYRATLGFGWPNELGMFLALGLPFSIHAVGVMRTRRARTLASLGVVANVLGLAATFSRGSWTAVLLGSLVLLFCRERRFVTRVWIAALVGITAIEAVSGGAISDRFTNAQGAWVVGQRLSLMLTGILMFRAHPLVGVGPGGFGASLEEFGPQIFALWDYIGSAHNLYIHMAAETGLIGLVALLVFLGTSLSVLFRGARETVRTSVVSAEEVSLRRALLWSFATACFVGLFEWTFAHGVAQLIILITAMGFALERERA
ncbi:MAG TPA: O-antigen ligase family protein [Longimicrobiaceae bacterium]|nr:O-antigen ligase family protein [Longimicrobiaceae bacterium]